jgi:hypothetical protein
VANPRPHLLNAVLAFVRAAQSTPGVLRIALLGSLATDKLAFGRDRGQSGHSPSLTVRAE